MQASGTVRAERREGEIPMEQLCKLPFVLLRLYIKILFVLLEKVKKELNKID